MMLNKKEPEVFTYEAGRKRTGALYMQKADA